MTDQELVRALRALADSNRFRMVREISAAGELTCGGIGERFALAQPTISHHLKILVGAGILAVRRDGQHSLLSVDHDVLDEALGRISRRLKVRFRNGSGGHS